jgi:signal transduction histidine kinase/CheY-like chemotaxis protein/HPt (histidine-containing phosphotransfer) domain-containing protein
MSKISVKPIKKISNNKFLVFSCILFLIIALAAVTAYSISARQINNSFIEQQLSIASETIRLRLASAVDSELALVMRMADTPVIRQHFLNPSDPVLKSQADGEFAIYKEHLQNPILYWVNDADKIFYSTGNAPYVVNPDDPANYWYNLTLYETEKCIFNINYNPDLGQIYLWVNVPVFVETETGKKPIGMIGTGINLTDFSDFVASSCREFDENITTYMFNKYNEITSAADYELVRNKTRLDEHLGVTGKELIGAAHGLSEGESRRFLYDKKIYLVNSIPSMEWHLAVSYPEPGLLSLNHAMNTVFFSMLFLILFMFIIINIFTARSENAIAKQNLRLLDANRKAESASRAKSDFLAKMSHEIRTPMNAITGMAELLLRGELSYEARGYAQDIKQAGNNLVSLINDILDLSKIEAGKLEIVPVKYMLSSLVNDTVNIIRTRFKEKPIRFITNIDGNIPNNLIGDEVRMRQILLNLLSNAVKYTEKGHVGLTITADKLDDKQVFLRMDVADTGKGIKPEHQANLFDEFVRVDIKKNQGIEGTGLGLPITRRLCAAMDGKLIMESEYGKGSVFTAIVPQGVESKEPFAAVDEPERKKVLVYESRVIYAKSAAWSLGNMKVPYTIATNQNEFAASLYREEWFYVFSSYGLYEKIKPFMEQDDSAFCGGKKPHLALMVEWGTEAHVPNTRFVSIPIQSLSIANALNGKADRQNYFESSAGSGAIRHTFPQARLLVVDDIAVNLKVAEGLLSPYNAKIDTCLSGAEAIKLVKQNKYDLIFMDHMMPEMDGIEATAIIRAWEKDQEEKSCMEFPQETPKLLLERPKGVPIIALTANAVVGMREMFIENGFNDFISKPVDVSKLDEVLNRWIPGEKRTINNEQLAMSNEGQDNLPDKDTHSSFLTPNSSLLSIPNVDTAKGVAMLRGKVDTYMKVLSMFCSEVDERLPQLQKIPEADTLPAFIIQVHSLKSVTASIGAQEISSNAAGLEAAGKAADMVFIRDHLPGFTVQLGELVKNIRATVTSPGSV